MHTTAPAESTLTASEVRSSVLQAHQRAEGFVLGFQYAHGTNWFDTRLAADFAAEYALGVAAFLTGERTILPPIPQAWSAWCAGNDISEPPTGAVAAVARQPDTRRRPVRPRC